MDFREATGTVYEVMSIIGRYKTRGVGDRTKCTFRARCTHEVDGENKTEEGEGSLIVLRNEKGGFDPVKAQFWIPDGTELEWLWDGERFKLVKENNETATAVGAVDELNS